MDFLIIFYVEFYTFSDYKPINTYIKSGLSFVLGFLTTFSVEFYTFQDLWKLRMDLKRSPSVSIINVPFCTSVKLFTMASPKPLPDSCLDLSPRTKRSVISLSKSSGALKCFSLWSQPNYQYLSHPKIHVCFQVHT